MNLDAIVVALRLPGAARVDRPVAKRLLAQHSTGRLRRRIDRDVVHLHWVSTLKPSTCGLREGKYLPADGSSPLTVAELSVFTLVTRGPSSPGALAGAVHRAICYPLLLLAEHAGTLQVSAAWKRPSCTQPDRPVLIDRPLASPPLGLDPPPPALHELVTQLVLPAPAGCDLAQAYQRWIDAILATQIAQVTGQFHPLHDPEANRARQSLLIEHNRLLREVRGLASRLRQARQVRDRVALSNELKQAEMALAGVRAQLSPSSRGANP